MDRWLSEEEEEAFESLWQKYDKEIEQEEDQVAPFEENEFSVIKSTIRDLVREKYDCRIEREMGLSKDRWFPFKHPNIVDEYDKEIIDMELEDFQAIYNMMLEERKQIIKK